MSDRNFFTEYALLNSNTEIPSAFSTWCGLSAVSAALGRRVYIDMGHFTIFPNMYIILIAGSGKMRKSTALSVVQRLLENLSPPPNLISQKLSAEYLLKKLRGGSSGATPDKIIVGALPPAVGQGFLISSELTNFLNQTTVQSGINTMLTELYDCVPRFAYGTLSRGEEILIETQLGILGATTPDELHRAIPKEGIGSGLASRIIFIYEDTPCQPVAFPLLSDRQLEAKEFCLRALGRFLTLSGRVIISPECVSWCEECYRQRCFNSTFYADPHLRGYASRRFVHILKLATIIAIGRTETPILTKQILEISEELLCLNEIHLPKIVKLVTMNEKGSTTHLVLSIIQRDKRVSRETLMKTLWHQVDNRELTDILDTLIRSDLVASVATSGTIWYVSKEIK